MNTDPQEVAQEETAATEGKPSETPEQQDKPGEELEAGNGSAGGNEERPGDIDTSDPMSLPPHGTEVFVGGIPKNATEMQLTAFAGQVGEVHSIKLAKDPNNPEQHRGFGFVRYFTQECAEGAKEKLHETQLQGTDVKLRVSSSQSKHRVYVGNLPRSWTRDLLLDELNKNVKGLENMDLVMSKEDSGQNRGFAFLTFYNHECAAAGKDFLGKPSYKLDGRHLTVSYAEPKNTELQQQSAQRSKSVYAGNLPPGVREDHLKEAFSKWGKVAKVVIPPATEKRPEQRFGFVHFEEQEPADQAVADASKGQKPEVLGNVLEVKAARPQSQAGDARQAGFDGGLRTATGYGARGQGRGPMRGGGRAPPGGRGRSGRGRSHGKGSYEYDGWYEQDYSSYERGYNGAYGAYGNLPVVAPASTTPGMTMVPMMLPSGQVGYVLQSSGVSGPANYGSYGGGGPDRGYNSQGGYGGRGGRGRGHTRYRPY